MSFSPDYVIDVGFGYAYTSIQAAIDAAQSGDWIIVHDGTYYENINLQGKAITVCSENGTGTTFIDGTSNGPVVTFDHNEGRDSILKGFTLTNGSADHGGGILEIVGIGAVFRFGGM